MMADHLPILKALDNNDASEWIPLVRTLGEYAGVRPIEEVFARVSEKDVLSRTMGYTCTGVESRC